MGCPLLSIHEYPTIAAQRERFTTRGWDDCKGADMNLIYSKFLDQEDVERIQRLELMDEFEEWHLIQSHYFVLVATRTGSGASAGDVSGSWVHSIAADFPDAS